jgi:hypothetical protein
MVNINDGMMGRSTITGNVLFNGCRESDDHGNFNSYAPHPAHLNREELRARVCVCVNACVRACVCVRRVLSIPFVLS